MPKSDQYSLGLSLLALLMSGVTFFQVQQDRRHRLAEEQPRISFSYSPYGVSERYGFSIRNVGDRRARIPHIVYTYSDVPDSATRSSKLLEDLNLDDSGYYRLIAGPSFVLEPRTATPLYTFSEPLNEERQKIWAEYTKLLAADICYCDVEFRQCWTKRVSRNAGQSVASTFQCDAIELRKALEAGALR